jgi:hypothetical protein
MSENYPAARGCALVRVNINKHKKRAEAAEQKARPASKEFAKLHRKGSCCIHNFVQTLFGSYINQNMLRSGLLIFLHEGDPAWPLMSFLCPPKPG